MAVTPLSLNNGNNPAPAATNAITLREFNGGPIAQPDAEANWINLTDRINDLITEVNAFSATSGTIVINTSTQINGGLTAGDNSAGLTIEGQHGLTLETSGLSGGDVSGNIRQDEFGIVIIPGTQDTGQAEFLVQGAHAEIDGDFKCADALVQGDLTVTGAIIGSGGGGPSTPLNNNLIDSHASHTGSTNPQYHVDSIVDITSYGGSASDKWGIFVIQHHGASWPNHETWVALQTNFAGQNCVFQNASDKSQTTGVQFLAPVDSSGKCYVRNVEKSSDPWYMYYMGSI